MVIFAHTTQNTVQRLHPTTQVYNLSTQILLLANFRLFVQEFYCRNNINLSSTYFKANRCEELSGQNRSFKI